jgi:diguanylate cyclase (GGDEF)-like protein
MAAGALVAAPVRRGERLLGVLTVTWPEPLVELGADAAALLDLIVAQGALAVEQADRLRAIERLVDLDPLTGLLNRRGLERELERELARAARGGALAVALIDLDGFKAINDREGHLRGDEVLIEVSAQWRARLRRSDLLARYGGDEFALIMVGGADEGLGCDVVARLRVDLPLGLSFSAGVAPWRQDEDGRALLSRADHALYAAKRAGRGRCCVAPSNGAS